MPTVAALPLLARGRLCRSREGGDFGRITGRSYGIGLSLGLVAMLGLGHGCARAEAVEKSVDLARTNDAGTGSDGQPSQFVTKMRVSKEIGVQIETPLWNEDCRHEYTKCVAQVPVVVENRSRTKVISVEGLDLFTGPASGMRVRRPQAMAPVRVAAGEQIRRVFLGIHDTEQECSVSAVGRLPNGAIVRASSDPFHLPNPARIAERHACERRGGRWESCYNMACYSRCAERASDAGKPCRDGLECEGMCLLDGYEDKHARDGRRSMPPALGHCSQDRSPRGCVTYIPNGASRDGADGYAWARSCAD